MPDESPNTDRRHITLKIYPDRRVEVDPPGAWSEPPPPNTPWLYLRDAARALRDCGSAPALYAGWRGEDGRPPDHGMAYLKAPGRQVEYARTSILFSSFAAEAYVNAFLAEGLGEAFAEVERANTIDKYTRSVRRVDPGLRFTKGTKPGQGLVSLFRARNALVHPKPGVEIEPPITPALAANSIVAVAQAARGLTAALGSTDLHALAIAKQARLFTRWADVCAAGLPDLLEEAPPDLFVVALNMEVGPSLNEHMRRVGISRPQH